MKATRERPGRPAQAPSASVAQPSEPVSGGETDAPVEPAPAAPPAEPAAAEVGPQTAAGRLPPGRPTAAPLTDGTPLSMAKGASGTSLRLTGRTGKIRDRAPD